jgi:hypothetical protein
MRDTMYRFTMYQPQASSPKNTESTTPFASTVMNSTQSSGVFKDHQIMMQVRGDSKPLTKTHAQEVQQQKHMVVKQKGAKKVRVKAPLADKVI